GDNPDQLPGEIILWDLDSGEPIRDFGGDLEGVIEGVHSIAITPDGAAALVGYGHDSAYDTHTAVLWDIEKGEVIRFLDGTSISINSVAISPDGRLGIGSSLDTNLYVWE